ncbi:hypothetical protein DFH07DRAFT_1025764 [Mycena maculata]|uniref:Uncharacterized protein n=1 Tax=Mycena maculata TaxID=230809 RepID=A0AAD7K7N3_9AGAR|nr:hypothetical protein DFH07DRAFT_1025764 [Mycena maculata]
MDTYRPRPVKPSIPSPTPPPDRTPTTSTVHLIPYSAPRVKAACGRARARARASSRAVHQESPCEGTLGPQSSFSSAYNLPRAPLIPPRSSVSPWEGECVVARSCQHEKGGKRKGSADRDGEGRGGKGVLVHGARRAFAHGSIATLVGGSVWRREERQRVSAEVREEGAYLASFPFSCVDGVGSAPPARAAEGKGKNHALEQRDVEQITMGTRTSFPCVVVGEAATERTGVPGEWRRGSPIHSYDCHSSSLSNATGLHPTPPTRRARGEGRDCALGGAGDQRSPTEQERDTFSFLLVGGDGRRVPAFAPSAGHPAPSQLYSTLDLADALRMLCHGGCSGARGRALEQREVERGGEPRFAWSRSRSSLHAFFVTSACAAGRSQPGCGEIGSDERNGRNLMGIAAGTLRSESRRQVAEK